MPLHFRLPVKPMGMERPRLTRNNTVYLPSKTRKAKSDIQKYLRMQYIGEPLKGPLTVSVVFAFKKPPHSKKKMPDGRPDVDNCLKLVLDAANKVLWQDDAQIVEVHARKIYAEIVDYILVSVEPLS